MPLRKAVNDGNWKASQAADTWFDYGISFVKRQYVSLGMALSFGMEEKSIPATLSVLLLLVLQ